MRKIIATLFAAAFTGATMAQVSPFAINWSTYKSGQLSQVQAYKTFTMRSQSDFANYWAASTGNAAKTAPTDIDWLKNEALAIHLGTRTTGGYSVSVRDIQMVRGDEYNVQVVEQVPKRGGMTTQMMTSPFTIILLPRRYAKYNVAVTKEEAGGWNQGGWPRDRDREDDRDEEDNRRDGYRLVERGELSVGPQQMKMDVVRSQRVWNRFWDLTEDEARVTRHGRSRARQIDWDQNQVLILQAGPLSPGMTMEITRVRRTPSGFQVLVNQHVPGIIRANARVTYPYFAIEVPGHSGKFDITVSTTRGM
jgi:hypothetical protein